MSYYDQIAKQRHKAIVTKAGPSRNSHSPAETAGGQKLFHPGTGSEERLFSTKEKIRPPGAFAYQW